MTVTEKRRAGERGTARVRARGGECVALAWEPDAEHVLDRVYRVTDLPGASQCPPLHRARLRRDPLLPGPLRGPRLTAARFAPTTLSPFERNPVALARRVCVSGSTMRDLSRFAVFRDVIVARAVLITYLATRDTLEINSLPAECISARV